MYVLSYSGLYLQADSTHDWTKLVDCIPQAEDVPYEVCDSELLTRLVVPDGMWRVSDAEGSDIVILESYCGRLYSLKSGKQNGVHLKKWGRKKGGDHFDYVNVQTDLVLSGLFRFQDEPTVAIQRANTSHYRSIFRCPYKLASLRDSVGLSHTPFGIPALNPRDSSIWLAIEGYHYIYIITMNGELRDSVSISFADYRRPPPPKSRMKSDAVVNDWLAQWTYITSFSYAPPGYFIMQYDVGKELCGDASRMTFHTALWNTDRQHVSMAVDSRWRIVGVQSDGRILFAEAVEDSSGCHDVLYVTRIEP